MSKRRVAPRRPLRARVFLRHLPAFHQRDDRMHPTPPAECLACGTCCYSQLDAYVRVTGADWSRLGARAEDVAHFIGNRAFMRMVEGHCIALHPDPVSGQFTCTLYEQRPQICRELSRGSPECLGELAHKAGRPRPFSAPSPEQAPA